MRDAICDEVPLILDEATIDAVMTIALRFDGYQYLDAQGSSDFSPLVEPMVESLAFSESDEENRAVFFALQRFLHKWGGERLSFTSREWSCYLLLFLHLKDKPVPRRFAWPEDHRVGPRCSEAQITAAAARVRLFFADAASHLSPDNDAESEDAR